MVVKSCKDCQAAGKNSKLIFTQRHFGKLHTLQEVNEECSTDFAVRLETVRILKQLSTDFYQYKNG